MTQFQPGDKVRLHIKPFNPAGVVESSDGITVRFTSGLAYSLQQYNVEVIEKAKLKAGDTIDSRSELCRLPVGTLVHGSYGTALGMVIAPNGTVNYKGELWEFDRSGDIDLSPYTVVYIPNG